MQLVFLGTGAGNGVPEFYCGCRVCKEAEADSRCRRTRCGVALIGQETILFDAPPELSGQLLREKIRSVDRLFLTHAHHDHVGGLGDLVIYARFNRGAALPAMMSRRTLDDLAARYGAGGDFIAVTEIEPGAPVTLDEVTVSAVAVAHEPGTLGYIIEKDGRRTAYIPDTGPLPIDTRRRLQGIDRLILDATFSGENWFPDEHLTIDAAIAAAQELDVGILYLTHLSMHYDTPVTCAELETRLKRFNGKVKLAYDGTRLDI